MLISIDGGCKRSGTPECSSVGVAWFQTEAGDLYFRAFYESHESTSQRGELNGLLTALEEANKRSAPDEDIIIITDSEYLYNSVTRGWSMTWEASHWQGSQGPVKNRDLWEKVNRLLRSLNNPGERVFMQWTKGHLISYSAAAARRTMLQDPTGIGLFMNIQSIASRGSEEDRIIDDFIYNRKKHDHPYPPRKVCLEWCVANTMADTLASYLVALIDVAELPQVVSNK